MLYIVELLQLLQRRERAGKPSIDSASPDKFTSTSDYYSLEVSPVSDISANTAARHRHAGEICGSVCVLNYY